MWLAREGFARLCGEPYSMRTLSNQRGHLTNMAIQLKGNDTDVPVRQTEEVFRAPAACIHRSVSAGGGSATRSSVGYHRGALTPAVPAELSFRLRRGFPRVANGGCVGFGSS